MDDLTDQRLPFTKQRGRLYVAPLGADLPTHYVASDPPLSGNDARFVDEWPDAWILGGETDPEQCSERYETDVESVTMRGWDKPIEQVTSRAAVWTFGMDRVNTRPVAQLAAMSGWHFQQPPRFMLGWESEDHRSRVIARQVIHEPVPFRKAADRLVLTYRLEQAEKPRPPVPPPPRLRWWQRLLRRRPVVPPPPPVEYHPPSEVYTVGQLRLA